MTTDDHIPFDDFESFWREIESSVFSRLAKAFAIHRYPKLEAYTTCCPYLLIDRAGSEIDFHALRPIVEDRDKALMIGDVARCLYLARPVERFALIFTANTPSDDIICCQITDRETHSLEYVRVAPDGTLPPPDAAVWINALPASGWFVDSIANLIEGWRERETKDIHSDRSSTGSA
jgi:hypothetical protein